MSYYNRFSSNDLPQKRIHSPSFSDKRCGSVDMISVSSRESFPDSDHRMSVCTVSTLPPTVSSAASSMSLDASTTPPMSLCASSIPSSTSSDAFIASPMSLYASSTASSMSIDPFSNAYPMPLYSGTATPMSSLSSGPAPLPFCLPFAPTMLEVAKGVNSAHLSQSGPTALYLTPVESAFSSRSQAVPGPFELFSAPPMLDVVKDINSAHRPQSTLPAIVKAESPVLRCSSASSVGLEYITPRPQLTSLCYSGSGDDSASIRPGDGQSFLKQSSSRVSSKVVPDLPIPIGATCLGITPIPVHGFPVIQGINKYDLLEFIRPETILEWEATPDPKAIVYIANDSFVTVVNNRVNVIRRILQKIFPGIDPIIGSSEPPTASFAHYQPPFPYLVSRLEPVQAAILTNQKCWSTPEATLFAMEFCPPASTFVMTLEGLHLRAVPGSCDIVASLVRRHLLNSPSIIPFIQRHCDNVRASVPPERHVAYIMDSIRVDSVVLGWHDEDPVVFNVYIHSPTNNPLYHRIWIQQIQSMTFFANCGTGKPVEIFCCSTCKGKDHPSEACPFLSVPGWHDVTLA